MTKLDRAKDLLNEQMRTVKWLTENLGKDMATVSRWCNNRTQPSIEAIDKITLLLKVDRRYFSIKADNNYAKNVHEDSRVRLSALMHLHSLRYRYTSKNLVSNFLFDIDTNIITDLFITKIREFNFGFMAT